jgi:hypothetical protein
VTREAIALYLSRLTADGVLAFHVSNRHLMLGPVVAGLAADAGLSALQQEHSVGRQEMQRGRSGSHWVVMARAQGIIAPLRQNPRWVSLVPRPGFSPWTDDFSNILSVLKR